MPISEFNCPFLKKGRKFQIFDTKLATKWETFINEIRAFNIYSEELKLFKVNG
jgi:hypothetical protein